MADYVNTVNTFNQLPIRKDLADELTDARTDYTGEVYTSAGNAIRGGDEKLNGLINQFSLQYDALLSTNVVSIEGAWSADRDYEQFSVVTDSNGNSYTSKQFVPAGTPLSNTDYWALTADYSSQVEQYRAEVNQAILGIQEWDSRLNTEINNRKIDIEKAHVFDTVADMKNGENLTVGAICHTNGFHESGDGGEAWYLISDSGAANEMDVIACGSLFANLVLDDVINIKRLGAYGDNENDDTASISRALDIANLYNKSVYMPNGVYDVSEELPKVVGAVCIYGANGSGNTRNTIIRDTRSSLSEDFLLSFEYDGTIGGCLKGISFITNTANNCIYMGVNVNWDMIIENVYIKGYAKAAIETDGSDNNYNSVQIVNCGMDDYALRFDQHANAQRFVNCHIEHCAKAIYLMGFAHSFTNLKVEQSRWSDSAQIKTDEGFTFANPNASFVNCCFIALGISTNEDASSFSDVPPFMDLRGCEVIGCQFFNGLGSGSHVYQTRGQAKYINSVRCNIANNNFNMPSYSVAAISATYSIVANNYMTLFNDNSIPISGDEALALINVDVNSVCKDNNVYSNVPGYIIAVSNYYDKSNTYYSNTKRNTGFIPSYTGIKTIVIRPIQSQKTNYYELSLSRADGAIDCKITFTTSSAGFQNVAISGRHNVNINLYMLGAVIYIQVAGSSLYYELNGNVRQFMSYIDTQINSAATGYDYIYTIAA